MLEIRNSRNMTFCIAIRNTRAAQARACEARRKGRRPLYHLIGFPFSPGSRLGANGTTELERKLFYVDTPIRGPRRIYTHRMIDSNFRTYFQAILIEPVAHLLFRVGLKPNQVTLAALFCGVVASVALVFEQRIVAITLLLLSGLLDAADGSLARKTDASTDAGCVLDIAFDRVVEAVMVVGLFLRDPTTRALPALILLASFYWCITTFLLSGIFEKNRSVKSFHYSPGLIERSETFAFFVVVMIWEDAFYWAAFIFAALVLATTLKRFSELLRLSSSTSYPPISQKNLVYPDQATMPTVDPQEKS